MDEINAGHTADKSDTELDKMCSLRRVRQNLDLETLYFYIIHIIQHYFAYSRQI